jgi:oligopeptide/dipeptide ABC transporter ATP-binding protein
MTDAASIQPLLSVRDLRTWFPIRRGVFSRVMGHVRAVDGLDLDVLPGETVGLVGESGCGKSTLGRTILGLEHATGGRVLFENLDLTALPERALRAVRPRLQMIFQDPFSSLNPRMTVVALVTEGLIEHGLISRREREAEAVRVLREVGLDEDALHRYPHEFSGGQRQRICIARAMALRPRLVVCDEAVSALDVSVRAQALNLLLALREKHDLAYLFISHDLGVVRHMASRVAVMYLGQIVESGRTASVLERSRHPYTRALLSAVPVPGRDGRNRIVLQGDVPSAATPPAGCRFHPRCPFCTPACKAAAPPLEPTGGAADPTHRVACIRKDELPAFEAGW